MSDPVISVVKSIVDIFELGHNSMHYSDLREAHKGMSRIMFDIVCSKAIKLGYISSANDRRGNKLFVLTETGKMFSLENNLVT